jgi:hypothetical protein
MTTNANTTTEPTKIHEMARLLVGVHSETFITFFLLFCFFYMYIYATLAFLWSVGNNLLFDLKGVVANNLIFLQNTKVKA